MNNSMDILDLAEAARLSKEFGWQAVAGYYSNCHDLESFEEAYNGTYESEEDFAYEIAHDIYTEEQLGTLNLYIDWERYARDLFISDYFSEKVDEGVAVFRRL